MALEFNFCQLNHLSDTDISYMEDKAQSILNRNYDILYDYFCNVLERDEEYKILRARRCQVLFQIFLPIIMKNEPHIEIRGKFISNQVLDFYKEMLLKSTVVILDDIVIHGRGLSEIYTELDPEFNNENIRVYVHKMHRDATSIPSKLKEKLIFDSRIFDWEWRELSTQLVNVIQATVTPYVSFVETYYCQFPLALQRGTNKFQCLDITSVDQENQGTAAYAYFEKDSLPPIIREVGHDACVRYYSNEKANKYIGIPYVFLKSLAADTVKTLSEFLGKYLPGNLYSKLKMELEKDSPLKYKTILISVLINKFYALYLNNKYPGMFDFTKSEKTVLYLCFESEIAEEIYGLKYEGIHEIFNNILEIHDCNFINTSNEDTELLNELKEAINTEDNDKVLELYFYLNRRIDENQVGLSQKRKKGLLIETFYKLLRSNIHNSSALQLKSWDSGIAACDIAIENDAVLSYARAGEQSFRYIIESVTELKKKYGTLEKGIEEFLQEENIDSKGKAIKDFLDKNKCQLDKWFLPSM